MKTAMLPYFAYTGRLILEGKSALEGLSAVPPFSLSSASRPFNHSLTLGLDSSWSAVKAIAPSSITQRLPSGTDSPERTIIGTHPFFRFSTAPSHVSPFL